MSDFRFFPVDTIIVVLDFPVPHLHIFIVATWSFFPEKYSP